MKKYLPLIGLTAGIIAVVLGIYMKLKKTAAMSISIIGGADGPTSVFVAGKVGNGIPPALILGGAVIAVIAILAVLKNRQR